ncbi:hypothetical protein Trydic_g17816 [Trypoxylus dichotomus]
MEMSRDAKKQFSERDGDSESGGGGGTGRADLPSDRVAIRRATTGDHGRASGNGQTSVIEVGKPHTPDVQQQQQQQVPPSVVPSVESEGFKHVTGDNAEQPPTEVEGGINDNEANNADEVEPNSQNYQEVDEENNDIEPELYDLQVPV